MSKNDGGAAFPYMVQPSVTGEGMTLPRTWEGMTLRDYFAAKAMANMGPINSDQDLKHMPAWAYKIADAMLAAREATGETP